MKKHSFLNISRAVLLTLIVAAFLVGCGELSKEDSNPAGPAATDVSTSYNAADSVNLVEAIIDKRYKDSQSVLAAGSWPGYNASPQSMWDFKWPWKGIHNACGGERWYIYAGYHSNNGSGYHTGLDEYAVDLHKVGEGSLGRWVLAPAYGTVAAIGKDPNRGYGYYVEMDHGNGFKSLVGHLKNYPYYLKVGDVLLQGTFLGYSGSTGWSSGPHIHFRVTRHNRPQQLSGISGYRDINRWWWYWSMNGYVPPPRGYRP